MSYPVSYRRHLTGAVTVAALMVNAPAAIAQPSDAQLRTGIDDAILALDTSPRLKELSPETKRQLVEFIIGNTLFVLAHEMGHGLINEMNMPVLGREEDAADSFAITTALKMGTGLSERVLVEAAKGLVLSAKRDKKEGNAPAFY